MSLLQLKQHLQQVHQCSLLDLCRLTKKNPDVLRDMLQHWIRKGKICQRQRTNACGKTCSQCDPLFIESYEWIA